MFGIGGDKSVDGVGGGQGVPPPEAQAPAPLSAVPGTPGNIENAAAQDAPGGASPEATAESQIVQNTTEAAAPPVDTVTPSAPAPEAPTPPGVMDGLSGTAPEAAPPAETSAPTNIPVNAETTPPPAPAETSPDLNVHVPGVVTPDEEPTAAEDVAAPEANREMREKVGNLIKALEDFESSLRGGPRG